LRRLRLDRVDDHHDGIPQTLQRFFL
jgi:hypothetical protein